MKSAPSKKSAEVEVSGYIRMFPKEVAARLSAIRAMVKKCAPNVEEVMSYGMPAYKYHGMLLYVAGYKNHIGLYAMPSAVKAFRDELRTFKTSKGTVQIPHDQPLPRGLITRIVKFRMKENVAKAGKM